MPKTCSFEQRFERCKRSMRVHAHERCFICAYMRRAHTNTQKNCADNKLASVGRRARYSQKYETRQRKHNVSHAYNVHFMFTKRHQQRAIPTSPGRFFFAQHQPARSYCCSAWNGDARAHAKLDNSALLAPPYRGFPFESTGGFPHSDEPKPYRAPGGMGAFSPGTRRCGYDNGGPYRCMLISHGGGSSSPTPSACRARARRNDGEQLFSPRSW